TSTARLPPPRSTTSCRSPREALSNAARHARAQHVEVFLRGGERTIELSICDDGVGFEPVTTGRRRGDGLRNMYTRADALNGRLSIRGHPPTGTKVCLE